MPAFVNSRVGSFMGTSGELRTILCDSPAKNSRNFWRTSLPFMRDFSKWRPALPGIPGGTKREPPQTKALSRCRPNASRRASAISPTVAFAFTAATM